MGLSIHLMCLQVEIDGALCTITTSKTATQLWSGLYGHSFNMQQAFLMRSFQPLLCTIKYKPTQSTQSSRTCGGTAAAAPPPFRPSEPALCGSCPIVTLYYCRLGDLLYFVFIVRLLCFSVIDVLYVSLQYFDTVGRVFWPVKTVSHITYTVLEGT